MQEIFGTNIEYHNQDGIEYIQFKKLLEYPEIKHCYTLRSNNGLNFPPIYKDEKMLKQSYQKISKYLGINPNTIIKPHQTHTDCVEVVDKIESLSDVDGMVTNQPNITLLTTSADCTSLLFYDPVKKACRKHTLWLERNTSSNRKKNSRKNDTRIWKQSERHHLLHLPMYQTMLF